MPRPQIRNPWVAWLVDTAERTARTFVQGFLAVVTLDGLTDATTKLPDTNLGLGMQLLAGALAGVYAVLTAFIAKPIGSPSSASLLPATLDPPQAGEQPNHGRTTLAVVQDAGDAPFVKSSTTPSNEVIYELYVGLDESVARLNTRVTELALSTVAERDGELEHELELEQDAQPSTRERIAESLLAIVESGSEDASDRISAARELLERELDEPAPAADGDSSC